MSTWLVAWATQSRIPEIVAILGHLELPTHPPALAPARGPPQPDLPLDGEPPLDLDQTPAFDPVEPDATPDFDFDQSGGA